MYGLLAKVHVVFVEMRPLTFVLAEVDVIVRLDVADIDVKTALGGLESTARIRTTTNMLFFLNIFPPFCSHLLRFNEKI
jgi:hypothetical protein